MISEKAVPPCLLSWKDLTFAGVLLLPIQIPDLQILLPNVFFVKIGAIRWIAPELSLLSNQAAISSDSV